MDEKEIPARKIKTLYNSRRAYCINSRLNVRRIGLLMDEAQPRSTTLYSRDDEPKQVELI